MYQVSRLDNSTDLVTSRVVKNGLQDLKSNLRLEQKKDNGLAAAARLVLLHFLKRRRRTLEAEFEFQNFTQIQSETRKNFHRTIWNLRPSPELPKDLPRVTKRLKIVFDFLVERWLNNFLAFQPILVRPTDSVGNFFVSSGTKWSSFQHLQKIGRN